MKQYTNYCTHNQITRAYYLGAPIHLFEKIGRVYHKKNDVYIASKNVYDFSVTTQQMIGWLREEHQLYCGVDIDENESECSDTNNCSYMFYKFNKCGIFSHIFRKSLHCYTYKEAELAAIDEALNYLEKKGE